MVFQFLWRKAAPSAVLLFVHDRRTAILRRHCHQGHVIKMGDEYVLSATIGGARQQALCLDCANKMRGAGNVVQR